MLRPSFYCQYLPQPHHTPSSSFPSSHASSPSCGASYAASFCASPPSSIHPLIEMGTSSDHASSSSELWRKMAPAILKKQVLLIFLISSWQTLLFITRFPRSQEYSTLCRINMPQLFSNCRGVS